MMKIPEEDINCTSEQESSISSELHEHSENVSSGYLEELFKQKCLFNISESKVHYIQDKIESVVSSLLTKVLESENYLSKVDSSRQIKKSLKKSNRAIQINRTLSERNLLKVGSFYENTKNGYPDEFDFICIVAECDITDYHLMKKLASDLLHMFNICISKNAHDYITECLPADKSLKFNRNPKFHGPATKLKFTLKDSDPELNNKSVYVDITPAVRVCLAGKLPEDVNVCYPDWKDVILKTGSILLVKAYCSPSNISKKNEIKVSITESEFLFVQERMSEKHRQVYRLLKFILNGNAPDSDRKIKQLRGTIYVENEFYGLSSYSIKLIFFHYMKRFQHGLTGSLTHGVVNVLQNILSRIRTDQIMCSSFPVSVETMTGEDITLFDEYHSAVKIKNILSAIVDSFKKTADMTSTENTAILDNIPLIEKASDIVQQAVIKSSQRIVLLLLVQLMILALGMILTTTLAHTTTLILILTLTLTQTLAHVLALRLTLTLTLRLRLILILILRLRLILTMILILGLTLILTLTLALTLGLALGLALGLVLTLTLALALALTLRLRLILILGLTLGLGMALALVLVLTMKLTGSSEVLYCWKGNEITDDFLHLQSSEMYGNQSYILKTPFPGNSFTDKTNSSLFRGHVFCIAFRSTNSSSESKKTPNSTQPKKVQNVSGLYACKPDNRNNGTELFEDNSVINASQSQPLWCKNYAFKTNTTLPILLNSAKTEQHSVCLQVESCLNVNKLTYIDGEIKSSNMYNCCTKIGCETPILKDVDLRSCVLDQAHSSQRQGESEICCCETESCEKHTHGINSFSVLFTCISITVLGLTLSFGIWKLKLRLKQWKERGSGV